MMAINARISLDSAVKIATADADFHAASTTRRAMVSAVLSCAITSFTRFAASACESPVH
jgi:hypothetical protein